MDSNSNEAPAGVQCTCSPPVSLFYSNWPQVQVLFPEGTEKAEELWGNEFACMCDVPFPAAPQGFSLPTLLGLAQHHSEVATEALREVSTPQPLPGLYLLPEALKDTLSQAFLPAPRQGIGAGRASSTRLQSCLTITHFLHGDLFMG